MQMITIIITVLNDQIYNNQRESQLSKLLK